jgi:hypothetical protein
LLAVAFEPESFQGLASDIPAGGGKPLSDIVRNSEYDFHRSKIEP